MASIDEGKRALLTHFASGTQECAERRARQGAAGADALDAERGQAGQAQTGQPDQDVDRPVDRPDDAGDVGLAAQAGRVQHVGTGFLIGLQPADGVGQIGAAMQEILGASVKVNGNGKARATSAAARMRSTASSNG